MWKEIQCKHDLQKQLTVDTVISEFTVVVVIVSWSGQQQLSYSYPYRCAVSRMSKCYCIIKSFAIAITIQHLVDVCVQLLLHVVCGSQLYYY